MRVAQVIVAGSFAGAEASACRLAKALCPSVEQSLIYVVQETRAGRQGCAQLVRQVKETGLRYRILETDRRVCRQLLNELRAALEQDRISVVHNHSYKGASYCGLLGRGLGGSSLFRVFTVHGFDQSTWHGSAFLHGTNVLGALLSDVIVTVSTPLASYYRRLPTLRNRVRVIPNGIELHGINLDKEPQTDEARRKQRDRLAIDLGLDTARAWVLCVGRLVAVKNHRLLFDATVLSNEPFDLIVVGDGPLEDELRREVAERGLTRRVHFVGHQEDVDALYRASDLLVLSSHSEGCPMVLLEAMSRGLAVVATAVGGVPDLIRDERDGRLTPPGDAGALQSAMDELLLDPERRRRLGRSAQIRVHSEFSATRWAHAHLDLYSQYKATATRRLG